MKKLKRPGVLLAMVLIAASMGVGTWKFGLHGALLAFAGAASALMLWYEWTASPDK